MKKQLFFSSVAVLSVSCNNSYNDRPAILDPVVERLAHCVFIPEQGAEDLSKRLQPFESGAQRFVVSSYAKSEVKGARGAIIQIDPSALEACDGSSLAPSMEISLIELRDKMEFLRHNIPTTSNGKLLVSGGAYHISCRSGGKEVQLKKGLSLKITVPKFSRHKMCLFYGERDQLGMLNWQPTNRCFENAADTLVKWKKLVVESGRGDSIMRPADPHFIDASCFKNTNSELLDPNGPPDKDAMESSFQRSDAAEKSITENTSYETVAIDRLGWINCDYYYGGALQSLISVHVPAMRYGALIKTFIVFKSLNSVMQYNLFGGEDEHRQYIRNLPAGQEATLIAFSYYEGKMYAYSADIDPRKNTALSMNLQPVSDQQIRKMMGLRENG